jgi:hypothetical protein
MTQDINTRKYKLIQQIIQLDDEQAISRIEQEVKQALSTDEKLNLVIKPIRKSLTIDQMVEEQEYKPIKADEFFNIANEIEWEESLEELLEMLD